MDPGATFRRSNDAPEEVRSAASDSTRRFGKFIRIERAGKGGWGEVWKAWETGLGRFVAIKTLTGGVEPEDRERFLREAQMAAKLKHPNIVAIHEQGCVDGVDYISMDFVAGQPLSKLRLSVKDGMTVMRDAARAVQAAHEQGLVHRDLKPANIMVEEKTGRAFVLDFGLARMVKEESGLSVSGTIIGTPAYMSPEQAQGHVHVDARADVYGLGATLYDVVTGHAPFEGGTILDVIKKVEEEEPPPPRRWNPRLDAEVDVIIQKAMEKDASRRYATAGEFADDLDRFLKGDPIAARPASLVHRVYKRIRKQPVAWGLAAMLVVAVVGGIAFGAVRFARQREAERNERAQTLAALRATKLAAAVDRALALMDEVDQITYRPDMSFEKIEPKARAMLKAAEGSLRDFPGEAKLWYYRGKALQYLGDDAGAEDAFTKAIALNPGDGRARFERGMIYMARYFEVSIIADDDRKAEIESGFLVWLPKAKADFEKAAAGTSEDEYLLASLFAEFNPAHMPEVEKRASDRIALGGKTEEFFYVRAAARLRLRRIDDALEDFSATLVRRPGHVRARTERGILLLERGRPAEALDDFEAVLRVTPNSVDGRYNRGKALQALRRFDEALAEFERVLRANPGADDAHHERGQIFSELGRFDDSLKEYGEALRINPELARGYVNRGTVYAQLHRFDEALADFEAALRRKPNYAAALCNRAIIYNQLERYEDAVNDFAAALRIDPALPEAFYNRGLTYRELDRFAEAVADWKKAIELRPEFETDLRPKIRECEKRLNGDDF